MRSLELKNLAEALRKVQAELKGAKKDAENPFYKSHYADLESCWEAARKLLTDNGFSIIQTMDSDEHHDYLITLLLHTSGEWIDSKLRLMPIKKDPQQQGSAITFGRRYQLSAMIGLIQTDDDANAATERPMFTNDAKPKQSFTQKSPSYDQEHIGPYRINFGKFSGKTLDEVGPDDLKSYVTYIEEQSKKDNKPIVGKVAEFIDRAVEYIVNFENTKTV